MRKLYRRLRSRAQERAQSWIRRRQGPDRDPVELTRNRIYILPTRLGCTYAAMLFAMVLGGMNYNNNLGLGLTFLLASLGLVTMHHCHGTLRGMTLRLLATEPAFAGQSVGFRLLLENESVIPRPRIELSAAAAIAAVVDVPATGSAAVTLDRPAARRGRVTLERFVVATRHPLGLFRAWAVVHADYHAIAWPRPAERGRVPHGVETDTGGAQDRAQGDADFAGLRRFQAGDSLHRVAWKAYARGQGLHTKQYAGTDVVSHVFDWDSLEGLDTEARLSQLCRWVLDAHERGEAFGLKLPRQHIAPNVGLTHRQHCLTALALFDAGAGHG
ncbi:MAG TPA: DUF58 domain-containing protein [Steroidobacteraceae bacterium]